MMVQINHFGDGSNGLATIATTKVETFARFIQQKTIDGYRLSETDDSEVFMLAGGIYNCTMVIGPDRHDREAK